MEKLLSSIKTENHQDALHGIEKLLTKQKKKKHIRAIVYTVCGLLFCAMCSLISWDLFYWAMDDQDKAALPFTEQLHEKVEWLGNSLFSRFGMEPSGVVRYLTYLGLAIVGAFAVGLILRILLGCVYHPKHKAHSLSGTKKENTQALLKLFSEVGSDSYVTLPYSIVYAVIYTLSVFVPLAVLFVRLQASGGELIKNPQDVIAFVLGALFLLAACFFVFLLLCAIQYALVGIVLQSKSVPYSKRQEVEKALKAKIKAYEKEEAAQKKAEEEAELAAKRQKAEEMYAQATAGEEVDEALMEEAAELGGPSAGLHVGRRLLAELSADIASASVPKKEKAKRAEKILRYLKAASDAGLVEGEFLYIAAGAQYESHSGDEWQSMLDRLRQLKKAKKIDKSYEELYQTLVGTLVEVIDATAAEEARLSASAASKASGSSASSCTSSNSYTASSDDMYRSVYSDSYTTLGGIDYTVHTTDAEGYSTSPYYEDAEGYRHSVDPGDVSEPFNWSDC